MAFATKNITVEEACHFLNIDRQRFQNLVRRGDFADIAEAIDSLSGEKKKKKYYIKAGAFLQKYALTWDDIFALREEMAQKGVAV
ncbi:MAG: helix-turn-helix domain-containing protein [Lachnospiraceae bacterium]|nr:helix-turn-helix domain-containing protein [Lachnospiraceae bacterium]